jgi:hypothetical protein
VRAYSVHWRRFSIALPFAAVLLYRVPAGSRWLIGNLLMILVLLMSIQREHQGFEDDWPEEEGDYLRFYGGPLAARPVRVRGELVAREIVDTATMLLPVIEDHDGHYVLNRNLKRYDWVRSAANNKSPSD